MGKELERQQRPTSREPVLMTLFDLPKRSGRSRQGIRFWPAAALPDCAPGHSLVRGPHGAETAPRALMPAGVVRVPNTENPPSGSTEDSWNREDRSRCGSRTVQLQPVAATSTGSLSQLDRTLAAPRLFSRLIPAALASFIKVWKLSGGLPLSNIFLKVA